MKVTVVQTSADLRQRLTPRPSLHFSLRRPAGLIIRVRDGVTYQHFRGAGGAMTDTSAWLIERGLRPRTRAWLLRHLFGRSGIDLNLIRVPIGASDFTHNRHPYSYDDRPPKQADPSLAHFSIAHDTAYILPALRQALARALRPFVLASLWSPPAWMKSNDSLGNPRDAGQLLTSAFAPLARYFVRFLRAYARRGVHVQAITPQNEPGQQSTYPGMNETAAQQESFIHSNLTPALRAARLRTAVYGYDGPWPGAPSFAGSELHSAAVRDLAGIATHCYYGPPTVMAALHWLQPHLDEIVSECSPGRLPFPVSELEIASLREWASGVELWNLALDPRGGPVQRPNYGCRGCTGIVTINPVRHRVRLGLNYYQLGQLTRFVVPGAVRIRANNFAAYDYEFPGANIASVGLDDVAFRNPDGRRVLLAFNGTPKPTAVAVQEGRRYFGYTVAPGATVTFVWPRSA